MPMWLANNLDTLALVGRKFTLQSSNLIALIVDLIIPQMQLLSAMHTLD